jgi:hypothetical protein
MSERQRILKNLSPSERAMMQAQIDTELSTSTPFSWRMEKNFRTTTSTTHNRMNNADRSISRQH